MAECQPKWSNFYSLKRVWKLKMSSIRWEYSWGRFYWKVRVVLLEIRILIRGFMTNYLVTGVQDGPVSMV